MRNNDTLLEQTTATVPTPRGEERAVRTDQARRQARLAVIGLLVVTATWGSTFVLLHQATARIPAADYLTVRFALATVVLAALRPAGMLTMPKALRHKAIAIGLAFGLGQLLLTVGLASTDASVSGFITGMYVIFTPVLGALFFRERLGRTVWLGAALAMAGLGVISLNGASIGAGEAITLAGAVMFALQIIGLGRWSDARYAIELAAIQAAVATLVCLPFALPGGITLPASRGDWLLMVYMAVVVGAVTMVLQTWAQTRIHPARAAVLMTMEPVWAATFAIALGGEAFTWRLAVGGTLVLGAMYLCERTPSTSA